MIMVDQKNESSKRRKFKENVFSCLLVMAFVIIGSADSIVEYLL